MIKRYGLPSLLSFLLFACKNEQKKIIDQSENIQFSYFELSYKGGWEGELSFCVDSNKIYFLPEFYPQNLDDTLKYGLLPDSLIKSINTVIPYIKTQQSDSLSYCNDCAAVSTRLVINNDTTNVLLVGQKTIPFWKLIKQLEVFRDNTKHNYIKTLLLLETAKKVSSPPSVPPTSLTK